MGVSHTPQVRKDVLLLLVKLFQSLAQPDFFSIAQCYVYLNEPTLASELLQMLVKRAEKDEKALENSAQDPLMIAYQIAFDLVESATQEFLKSVQQDVQQKLPAAESGPGAWAAQIVQILSGEETIKFYRDFLKHANHADLAILKKSKDCLLYTSPSPRDS